MQKICYCFSNLRKNHRTATSDEFEPMSQLIFKDRNLWLMRPYANADYTEKYILTKSIFNFVDAWLVNQKIIATAANSTSTQYEDALYYWRQAKNYYTAGIDLRSEVKPLLNYYCCLNSVKCLIKVRDSSATISNLTHGVGWEPSPNANLDEQKIDFQNQGALWHLRSVLEENNSSNSFSLRTLLYNLASVHRAYTYTFPNDEDLFIPLKSLKFYKIDGLEKIKIALEISKPESNLKSKIETFSAFEVTSKTKEEWDIVKMQGNHDACVIWAIDNDKLFLRSKAEEDWKDNFTDAQYKESLLKLHKRVRPNFQYISASTPLWYLKKRDTTNSDIIHYSSTVISYAVMHCLSEMVRYRPELYSHLLDSKYAWLITEFIEVGIDQFIDEIAGEITGLNIMRSGVKAKC